MNDLKDKLTEYIEEELAEGEIIAIHNEYCDRNSYSDTVYNMYMLDEIVGNGKPFSELLEELNDGFRVRDNYFWWHDLYGLRSGNDLDDLPIEINDISEYILDNNDSLENDDIQEFLDKLEEEGEEE